MSKRMLRVLPRLTLAVLILAALVGVFRSLQPMPGLPPRLTLAESKGYLLAGFSPDGRTLVGISTRQDDKGSFWAGPLRLWDTDSGRVIATVGADLAHCWPP